MLNYNSPINDKKEYSDLIISEIEPIIKINLRGKTRDFLTKIGKSLSIIPPTEANTSSENDILNIIWLSPDEWMVVNDQENELFIKLQNELGDIESSVTDVSENRTIIRLSGKKIFTLLSKYLVLDMEKSLGTQSSCAQTLFVKVPILLVRNEDNDQIPVIDIFINRSHANYIYNLLVDGTKNLDF